jgi:hypothetical protein
MADVNNNPLEFQFPMGIIGRCNVGRAGLCGRRGGVSIPGGNYWALQRGFAETGRQEGKMFQFPMGIIGRCNFLEFGRNIPNFSGFNSRWELLGVATYQKMTM